MTNDAIASVKKARHPELAQFVLDRAILRGNFTLVSGRKSSYYCDGKQVSFSGKGLALVTDAIAAELRDVQLSAIGGMDMGATPIVAATALRLHQLGRSVAAFVVRKDVKGHGTKKEIEGPLPEEPSQLVIVDDVISSGGSIVRSIEAVRNRGHEVVLALSILDRDMGGGEKLASIGVPYQPLVTIAEIGITNVEPS